MDFSTLRLVNVCTNCVLRTRNGIVGKSLIVNAIAVRVGVLFIVGTIAFDRALLAVRIVGLLCHLFTSNFRNVVAGFSRAHGIS